MVSDALKGLCAPWTTVPINLKERDMYDFVKEEGDKLSREWLYDDIEVDQDTLTLRLPEGIILTVTPTHLYRSGAEPETIMVLYSVRYQGMYWAQEATMLEADQVDKFLDLLLD